MFANIHTFKDLVLALVGVVNILIPVLMSLALLAFMITAFRLLLSAGDSHHRKERRDAVVWSIIALFVLVSIWGLVNLLLSTFFPNTPGKKSPQDNFYAPAPGSQTGDTYTI